jgi:hypothetical protein
MPIQVQEPSRTPNRHDQNRISSWHIINTTSTKNKAVKEKNQTTYKGKPSRFLNRNLKSRKGMEWGILSTERQQFQSSGILPIHSVNCFCISSDYCPSFTVFNLKKQSFWFIMFYYATLNGIT